MGERIFKKIMIAVDGSENSKKAATIGIELAVQNKADIYVLYVIDLNVLEDIIRIQRKEKSEAKIQLEEKAKIYVTDIQKLCEAHDMQCKVLIKEGTVSNEIVKEVKNHKIDLLIMAHHSRTGTGSMRLGSVCSGVLEFTPCPVLIIR